MADTNPQIGLRIAHQGAAEALAQVQQLEAALTRLTQVASAAGAAVASTLSQASQVQAAAAAVPPAPAVRTTGAVTAAATQAPAATTQAAAATQAAATARTAGAAATSAMASAEAAAARLHLRTQAVAEAAALAAQRATTGAARAQSATGAWGAALADAARQASQVGEAGAAAGTRTAAGMAQARRETRAATSELTAMRLAAATAVGSWLGRMPSLMTQGARAALTHAHAMSQGALQTGMAADEYQRLYFATTQTGATMEQVNVAIAQMQVRLSRTPAELAKLGVEVRSLAGMKPEGQFAAMAETIAAIPDPAKRAQAAIAAFGESGSRLLPLLSDLRRLREEADRAGVVLDNQTLESAARFRAQLSRSWQQFQAEMGRAMAAVQSAPRMTMVTTAAGMTLGAVAGGAMGGPMGATLGATVGAQAGAYVPRAGEAASDQVGMWLAKLTGRPDLSFYQQAMLRAINEDLAEKRRERTDQQGQEEAAQAEKQWAARQQQAAALAERMGQHDAAQVHRAAAAQGRAAVLRSGAGGGETEEEQERAGMQVGLFRLQQARQLYQQMADRRAAVTMGDTQLKLYQLDKELALFRGTEQQKLALAKTVAMERVAIEQQAAEQMADRTAAVVMGATEFRLYQLDQELARFKGTEAEKQALATAAAAERAAIEQQVAQQSADRIAAVTMGATQFRLYQLDQELARFKGTEAEKLALTKAVEAERAKVVREARERLVREEAGRLDEAKRREQELRVKALTPEGRLLREERTKRVTQRREARERARVDRLADSYARKVGRNAVVALGGGKAMPERISRREKAAWEWREAERDRRGAEAADKERLDLERQQLQELRALHKTLQNQMMPMRLG